MVYPAGHEKRFLALRNQLCMLSQILRECKMFSKEKQGSFLHEHVRPLNRRFARRLTTGSAFIKMARLKAIIEIILLVDLDECTRDLTKFVSWIP